MICVNLIDARLAAEIKKNAPKYKHNHLFLNKLAFVKLKDRLTMPLLSRAVLPTHRPVTTHLACCMPLICAHRWD